MILVVIVFALYLAYIGRTDILSQIIDQVTTRIAPFKSAFEGIQTTWASIPDSIRGILIAGIPTAFMLFFAWTKSRAMQQLQQTQQQAASTITNLEGQIQATQQTSQATIEGLQKQLTTAPSTTALSDLQTNLTETQALVTKQATEIQTLITERNTLARLVEELKLKTYEVKVVQ